MTAMNANEKTYVFQVKDRYSALTHLIGCVAAVIGMPVLLIHGAERGADLLSLASCAIFMIGMITLYAASASYHTFDSTPAVNDVLKKFDHLSIFILIAASYTPVCCMPLRSSVGPVLLLVIWSIALAGMLFKFFFTYCPRWVSSVLYTAMGWACVFVIPTIWQTVGTPGFWWLLAGGILYSAGAVFYAVKKPLTGNPEFGNHEIFHCFVLAGSLCHYVFVYLYLL